MYELEEVTFHSNADWDAAVRSYTSWHLYHLGAWLDFVEETQPVTRRIYAIREGDRVVGYLPGFGLRKGLIRVFGSPLPGWTTPYMGPVMEEGVDTEAVYRAISDRLRRDGFRHAEIRPRTVDGEAVLRSGFMANPVHSYMMTIGEDPESILANCSKSTRKIIRRGLQGEIKASCTEAPAFVDCFYDQLREVFEKSGTEPTFPRERVRALWKHMMPTGRMLATKVTLGDTCIATRMDFCGNGWFHAFASASRREHLKHHPNELARYHAMCEAAKRGLTRYDLTGGGAYKAKFNADLVEIQGFIQSSRLLMLARQAVKRLHWLKIKVKYLLRRAAHREER